MPLAYTNVVCEEESIEVGITAAPLSHGIKDPIAVAAAAWLLISLGKSVLAATRCSCGRGLLKTLTFVLPQVRGMQ